MSGIGIDLSSTTIRASYNLDQQIIALPLKEVAQSQDVGIWPILYFGNKPEIDSEAIERLAQQPDDVITNIVHAMEIMDSNDKEVRAQQLEWGSPITFDNGSFYYDIKSTGKRMNIRDVLKSIFIVIQSRFEHIADHQNKAVITVPATFGENATHIVKEAGKVFGTCTVITHDLAAIQSHDSTPVDSLVICCGEYMSTASLYKGSEQIWLLSFSDLDLPHELYQMLQSNPSYSPSADMDNSMLANRASLYCEARALALKAMNNQPLNLQDGILRRMFFMSRIALRFHPAAHRHQEPAIPLRSERAHRAPRPLGRAARVHLRRIRAVSAPRHPKLVPNPPPNTPTRLPLRPAAARPRQRAVLHHARRPAHPHHRSLARNQRNQRNQQIQQIAGIRRIAERRALRGGLGALQNRSALRFPRRSVAAGAESAAGELRGAVEERVFLQGKAARAAGEVHARAGPAARGGDGAVERGADGLQTQRAR